MGPSVDSTSVPGPLLARPYENVEIILLDDAKGNTHRTASDAPSNTATNQERS
jgi:hypothetical protein